MRVYIAYKYTNIGNKTELKINLEHIAQVIENLGNKTFLLNRDLKEWGYRHVSLWKNVFTIMFNILKSDVVFVYDTSDVISIGITFEIAFSKLFGKRIILAIENNIKDSFLRKSATEVIEFEGLKELEAKIGRVLKSKQTL